MKRMTQAKMTDKMFRKINTRVFISYFFLLSFLNINSGYAQMKINDTCFSKTNFLIVYDYIEDQIKNSTRAFFEYKEYQLYPQNKTEILFKKQNYTLSVINIGKGIFSLAKLEKDNAKLKAEAKKIFCEILKLAEKKFDAFNEPEQKKAQSCKLEFYFHFTNMKHEKQKLRDGNVEDWQAYNPLYEMLIPQHGNFSLMFCFDNCSTPLAYEVPVNDIEELLTEFKDSMNLKEGEQRFIRTTLDSLIFVIKRRNDEAIVYNLYYKKNTNADYDLSYHVPWVEYEKMINNTLQKYSSLIQNVENLAFKFLNETSQSISMDGIVLTAHADNKAPVIGSSINITLKITNVSSETKELVNDFEISSGSANPFDISISGNPLAGLRKKPVTLKPGESFTLQKQVTLKRFESTIKVSYSADNDFSKFTNMVPACYLDMLRKRGIHPCDLTKCWQGELETEISLFVLTPNWKEVLKTELGFEEWLFNLC